MFGLQSACNVFNTYLRRASWQWWRGKTCRCPLESWQHRLWCWGQAQEPPTTTWKVLICFGPGSQTRMGRRGFLNRMEGLLQAVSGPLFTHIFAKRLEDVGGHGVIHHMASWSTFFNVSNTIQEFKTKNHSTPDILLSTKTGYKLN